MKISLSLIIFFFSISQLVSQNKQFDLKIKKSDRGSYYLLMKDNQVMDSILFTNTNDILVDYKIVNNKKILILKKNFLGYFYYNMEKSNNVWKKLISSGIVDNNYGGAGAYVYNRQLLKREYEILEEDRILIKNGENERIFECSTIADSRRAWLQKLEKLQKN